MFPIIQHRDQLWKLGGSSDRATEYGWRSNQNACHLPFQYGLGLDEGTMARDVLYALSDVFRLSAASEGQTLNLVQRLIAEAVDASEVNPRNAAPIVSLRSLSKALEEHITGLSATVLLLRDRDHSEWPRAIEPDHKTKGDRMASLLLRDFEHLLQRAEMLSKSCQEGVRSVSAAVERRRATQAESAMLLGCILAPAALTTSGFGMNFTFIENDNIGTFFAVLVPLMFATFFLWWVLYKMWLSKLWKALKPFVQCMRTLQNCTSN